MAKTENNNYFVTALLVALFFSLSAVPGARTEAEVGSVTLPSTADAANVVRIRAQLPHALAEGQQESNVANSDISMGKVGNKQLTAAIAARMVKAPQQQLPGDIQPTPERDVVEYSIQNIEYTIKCEVCPENKLVMRMDSAIEGKIEARDFKNIDDKIHARLKAASAELEKSAQEEVTRLQKVRSCEIDDNGARLSGPSQLSCRVQRFNQLAENERENYFDQYIREDLHKAIKEGSGAMRDHAMAQVSALQAGAGNSTYLNSSLKDMQMFGEAHKAAEKIIANGRRSPSFRQDVEAFERANNYLASRGLALNSNVASALGLTVGQQQNERALVSDYEKALAALTQQHQSLLNGAQGVRPLGTTPGRQQFGTTATSYPGGPSMLPPNSSAPGTARPGAPAVPGRGGVNAPVGRGGPILNAPGAVR